MTFSIISLYGKCFTDATHNKAPKLESDKLFQEQEELFEIHNYLMDLRHHFISHRGESEGEVEAAYIIIPKAEGEPQIRYQRLKQVSFTIDQLEEITKLINFVLGELANKIQKSGQKAYSTYLKLFTPEQMSFMMLNNMKEV